MVEIKYLYRIDWRVVFIILLLQCVSLVTISSYSRDLFDQDTDLFMTATCRSQCKWFAMGWGLFFFFSAFDYNKLREWAWLLYAIALIALLGLFFVDPIQRVHRWYRLPLVGFNFQPSEYTKLGVIIAMSWFLERRASASESLVTGIGAVLIAGIPFLLILKQPDLGTALVLYPLALVMGYFGNLHPLFLRLGAGLGLLIACLIFFMFSGIVSQETIHPIASRFLKEYQIERLNPNTHHQKAAMCAIGVGGLCGAGWQSGEYTRGGSLPAPYTDSIFSAFGEEFGFFGLVFLLILFYALLYCSFQVTTLAKEPFGRLLAAGIATLVAVHVIVNIGMLCGMAPITGVPLVLVSYGGSHVLATSIALGILQSIYSRRFMF
jgi:rod shape determining protein RodA